MMTGNDDNSVTPKLPPFIKATLVIKGSVGPCLTDCQCGWYRFFPDGNRACYCFLLFLPEYRRGQIVYTLALANRFKRYTSARWSLHEAGQNDCFEGEDICVYVCGRKGRGGGGWGWWVVGAGGLWVVVFLHEAGQNYCFEGEDIHLRVCLWEEGGRGFGGGRLWGEGVMGGCLCFCKRPDRMIVSRGRVFVSMFVGGRCGGELGG